MTSQDISTAYSEGIPDWSNLEVLHKNTLLPRAYFHVYNSEDDALTYDASKSRTHSLSGTWKFQHSWSPFEAPEGFESPSFDTSSWNDIAVPGMWQLQGFGKGPQYTNVQFHIPVDPPNVSFTDNETGSYVKNFRIPDGLKGNQIRLRFEGVDSSYHVWVNGKAVGYSQGSRNPDEFDITEFVDQDGDNTIAVRVYQLCDGSYIEDQDQWWLSGIFRDVALVGFPLEARIDDVHIKTAFDTDYRIADLKLSFVLKGAGHLEVMLLDPRMNVVRQFAQEYSDCPLVRQISIPVGEPLKWTAETPHLYHLVLSLNHEQYFAQRVGFRQVEIKDGLIKVNGDRILFRGVNRHEHHPKYGRTVPLEFLKEDLLTMKRHNINAIRTSHQLNDPRLLDLCDEMGFWVMDEADLECHGFESIEDAGLGPEDRALPFRERQLLTREKAAQWTTDNPDWTHAYVDRAIHLVKRDQLHPSVIVWSLGNEAFFGQNFKAMYDCINAYDGSRPIHYEADIHAETMDMYSKMYPPVEEVIAFGEDKTKKKPLVLCEFIHAMGNGPGNIKEYVDAFYKYPTLQGGFAWEWANHGLEMKDKETGETYYAYGGDFGEELHDSTFVMDGLVNSDHTPNPGLTEYKKAIEPVQFVEATQGKATFINRYDFLNLDHLQCITTVISDSQPSSTPIPVHVPDNIRPGEAFEIDIPLATQSAVEMLVNVSFQLGFATPCLPSGFEIATAQIPLSSPRTLSYLPSADGPPARLAIAPTSRNTLEIRSETNSWTFNTLYGTLTSWKKGSVELVSKSPTLSFFRAQTDNDIPQDGREWNDALLHLAKPSTRNVRVSASDASVTIAVTQRIAPPVLSWSIDAVLTYTFTASALNIHIKGVPRGANLPRTVPRIGLVMEMPSSWSNGGVEWFGRGPGESYRDSKESQLVGNHRAANVDELWVDYEVPQESSNRTDTRWLKLGSDESSENAELLVQFMTEAPAASSPSASPRSVPVDKEPEKQRLLFDFQASHYRMVDVAAAKHPFQLHKKKREEVVLRLDYQHHGLGSGSCGPRTRDEYALLTKEFEFEVLLQ